MTPWVMRLLVANIGVFLLQMSSPGLASALAYIPRLALREPWTIITYMFLHGGFMHLLFNMIGLYFFGPRVEQRLGSTRFFIMYFIAGISGAVASSIFAPNSPIIGASAGVFGVMMAYAVFWPRDQVMIWGVLPVEVRVLVVITTVFAVFSGAMGSRGGVADFAHLGGYAGAYIYLLILKQTAGNKRFKARVERPPPHVEKKIAANLKNVDLSGVHEISKTEVNRILDKISAEGIGSLTAQEKIFLSNFVPMDDRKPIS
jgi:membrane associated rhomboid family serine protease